MLFVHSSILKQINVVVCRVASIEIARAVERRKQQEHHFLRLFSICGLCFSLGKRVHTSGSTNCGQDVV